MDDRINKFPGAIFRCHMREVTAVSGAVIENAPGVGTFWVEYSLYRFKFGVGKERPISRRYHIQSISIGRTCDNATRVVAVAVAAIAAIADPHDKQVHSLLDT
jgi:hypothetical protein